MTSLTGIVRRTMHGTSAVVALMGTLAMIACSETTPTETIALPILYNASAGHADATGRTFDEHMTQEVTSTFAGDPDGVGTAVLTINVGQREVCWQTSVSNIALPATGSHIHAAAAGTAGPIVVPLSPPDAAGQASGCAHDVDRDLLVDIVSNPDAYYVNVHSREFPPGAIRSQLR